MPELFTLPGPRNGEDNFASQYYLPQGTYTVDAETRLYASITRMFWADHEWVEFINHGTIWNISNENVGSAVVGFNIYSIQNSGNIIVDAINGNAGAVFVGSGVTYAFDNSGSIYAIANGNATAVEHWAPDVDFRNTGLIAAYAPRASEGGEGGVGSAVGAALYNGGFVTNGPAGSILAEGLHATAILYGRGSVFADNVILNAGLIEAVTTSASELSYGIRAGGSWVEFIYLVNDGVLRADVAWSSYGDHPQYAPMAADGLTNNAGGSIIGRIETGVGADFLVNHGSVVGDVALGQDNDRLDTSTGTLVGSADLGWHDDTFLGSAGGDVVTGNRGNDELSGNGGNDLLLGGIGHDRIAGGAGNDGLYGELGEDCLVTIAGDRAYGGDGDDFIEADDLAFALISGGAGYDSLRLDVGPIALNLGSALSSGRLQGIERIILQADQQIAVRSGDAAALADGSLDITGQGGGHVALVGAWSESATSVRDGVTWRSFSLGDETVFVSQSATVAVVASLPAAFGGLAPVAAGAAAPAAGSVPGGELSNPVQQISLFLDHRNIIVDEGEVWQSTDANVILGYSLSHGIVNAGVIEATNAFGNNHISTISNDVGYIVNTGTIRGNGVGAVGIDTIKIRGALTNWGTVEAIADGGPVNAVAVGGVSGSVLENYGTISARSPGGTARGAQIGQAFDWHLGSNQGLIEAWGGAGTTALLLLSGGSFRNDGTVLASNNEGSGVADATAVLLWNNGWTPINQFINHGSIQGVTAISSGAGADDIINTGDILGVIELGTERDWIENSGVIMGRITLGGDSDAYLGAHAGAAAEADGGDGADLLFGGPQGDRFDGGAGNDLLVGGGGADVLTGGAGADRFVYFSAAHSVAGSADTIEDFESGVDTIDLGALAPTSVDLSAAGGVTTIAAQTSEGLVTIRVSGTVMLSDIDTSGGSVITGTSADEALIGAVQGSDIRGGGGQDLLLGTDGNDQLNGGAGTDFMHGGAGDDVYIVDAFDDYIIERSGGGIDRVIASSNYNLAPEVEHLTLINAATSFGNALHNSMQGSSGDDSMFAGDGDDILIGGGGGDYLDGGFGTDRFVYQAPAHSTSVAYDTIVGFEYGIDKIDLSDIGVLSINWHRVHNQFDSYEEVTVATLNGPMTIRVVIHNLATSGLSMADFVTGPPPLVRAGLILTQSGQDFTIGGDVSVVGTTAGGETIEVIRGDIRLDGSFNIGGDTVVLPGLAGSYTATLSGSFVTIAGGDVSIAIPVGAAGLSVQFDDSSRTLRFDTDSGAVMLGTQPVTSTIQPVASSGPPLADVAEVGPESLGKLILTDPGQDIDIGGNVEIFGTIAGGEVLDILHGTVLLDGSFNIGGDTVVLAGNAASFEATLSGSFVTIAGGDTSIAIPVGVAGLEVQFDDGARTLRFDPESGQVMLGDQVVTSTTQPVEPSAQAFAAEEGSAKDFAVHHHSAEFSDLSGPANAVELYRPDIAHSFFG